MGEVDFTVETLSRQSKSFIGSSEDETLCVRKVTSYRGQKFEVYWIHKTVREGSMYIYLFG